MSIRCDNLLLKSTKYHLLPLQLHTQIESNLSHNLLSAYDHYKEKHDSASDSDGENNPPEDNNDATAATETVARKAENCLELFIQLLIRLDNKVHSCQPTVVSPGKYIRYQGLFYHIIYYARTSTQVDRMQAPVSGRT